MLKRLRRSSVLPALATLDSDRVGARHRKEPPRRLERQVRLGVAPAWSREHLRLGDALTMGARPDRCGYPAACRISSTVRRSSRAIGPGARPSKTLASAS